MGEDRGYPFRRDHARHLFPAVRVPPDGEDLRLDLLYLFVQDEDTGL